MTSANGRRTVPIHQSFVQPLLVLGAERDLVILAAVMAATLVFSLANAYFAILGTMFWLTAVAALQRLAKIDPQMSRVYIRHVRYRHYYPACAHVDAPTREPNGLS